MRRELRRVCKASGVKSDTGVSRLLVPTPDCKYYVYICILIYLFVLSFYTGFEGLVKDTRTWEIL